MKHPSPVPPKQGRVLFAPQTTPYTPPAAASPPGTYNAQLKAPVSVVPLHNRRLIDRASHSTPQPRRRRRGRAARDVEGGRGEVDVRFFIVCFVHFIVAESPASAATVAPAAAAAHIAAEAGRTVSHGSSSSRGGGDVCIASPLGGYFP